MQNKTCGNCNRLEKESGRLQTENRTLRETNADLRAQIQMLRERYGINQNKPTDALNLNTRKG